MPLFSKDYHPLDSRHPRNRAQVKDMHSSREGHTRSGKRKIETGGLFNRTSAQELRERLTQVESAPSLDLTAQKRLKRALPAAARKDAEKDFWASQGILGHLGIFGLINQVRALLIGDKKAGTKTWISYAKFPLAALLYLAIVKFSLSPELGTLTTELSRVDGTQNSLASTLTPNRTP